MKQNRVPAPWTPISVNETEEGISVSVLGRVYNFGHSMFPQSITADGEELLSEPIRLLAQDNGADAVWRNSETWIHEASGRRVVLMSAMESRFAVISTIITIDYDGCIQYDMRLSTCADSVREGFDVEPDMDKRVVNRLWLEVPLKKEHSVFEHRNEAYYSGYSRDISLPFTPISWFGSDKRGLEICFESNEHWNPLSKEQAIETFADEAKRTLRFRFLDDQPKRWQKEAEFADKRLVYVTPIHYQFSITATPTKPCDEKWLLSERFIHVDCFDRINTEYLKYFTSPTSEKDPTVVLDRLKAKGVTTLTLHQKWNPVQGYWKLGARDSERIHKLIHEAHKRGIKIVFYFCNTLSTLRPEKESYMLRNAHVNENGQPVVSFYRTPPQRTYRSCAAGPDLFEDFTKGMAEFVREYGVDGVYIDSANIPWACANEAHGCGWTDEDGIRHATYPISAMRESFRKIWETIHEELGKTVQIHPYNSFIPSVLAYGDLYWTAEFIALSKKTDTNAIIEAFSEDVIRAEFCGRNIGVPCQILAYDLPDGSWTIKSALAVTAPYGVYPRPVNIHSSLDVMAEIWRVFDEIDICKCDFHPFYRGNVGASCKNNGIIISSYEKEDELVLLISNPSQNGLKNVVINCDFAAECELVGNVPLSGKEIQMDLEPWDVRFVRCSKNK
ncbi:MAG: hypothetical protein IKK94_03055 [Clostridia bacterium]|nr:hypothetical protein [Clostridia bacterium]